MPAHPPIVDRIVRVALAAADPAGAVLRAWPPDLDAGGPVALLALGKASVGMAGAALGRLGDRVARGLVVGVPEHVARFDARGTTVNALPADHPLPTERNVHAGEALLACARSVRPEERALVLVSGGGSAQLTLPPEGVTLADVRAVTDALLRAGATIDELNAVRKHLDRLKGGRLARELDHAAGVEVLVLSDVLGDRLDVISSGPTAPDPTTFADARGVLDRRGVRAPAAVQAHLRAGADGRAEETPKPGDRAFARVNHWVIASNAVGVEAVAAALRGQGWMVRTRTGVTGEASEVGRDLAREVLAAPRPTAIVWGGETTVTVGKATGVGGRNQELALAAAVALDGARGVGVVALGTDGIDGPTDAAGGFVSGRTAAGLREAGVDPVAALGAHDTHTALGRVGALIRTGPTGTNVNDLSVGLAFGGEGWIG